MAEQQGWAAVNWTETRQILEAMDAEEDEIDAANPDMVGYYAELKDGGQLSQAVSFLGTALPRFESLAWGARFLDDLSREDRLRPRDRQALDSSLRWLGEPDEEFRQAAKFAADTATDGSAEYFIALAVWASGGSISLPDLEPVAPPPSACNRAATGAVLMACYRGDAPDERLARALDLGERFAREGMGAFNTA